MAAWSTTFRSARAPTYCMSATLLLRLRLRRWRSDASWRRWRSSDLKFSNLECGGHATALHRLHERRHGRRTPEVDSLRCVPAVDHDRLPGDSPRLLASQEKRIVGDLLRRKEASYGNQWIDDLLEHAIERNVADPSKVAELVADERSIDVPGAERVYRDPVRRPLEGRYARETDDAMFGAVVCRLAGESDQSIDRSHVDDASVAFAFHDREDSLRRQEWREQHHAQQQLEFLRGKLLDR